MVEQRNKIIQLKSKSFFFALSIICAVPLLYVIYKAFTNSFTHDESFSYNYYVNTSVWDIITYKGPDIPNSHILNTLLMKFSQALFGSSEFALRLPNVIAYCTYIIFSLLWLRKFNNGFLLITGFIILNYNPFILDFFALARGYGLAICCMFISFYFFYNLVSSLKTKNVLLSFTFAALAVWSNFTLLNYYIGLFITYNFLLAFNSFKAKATASATIRNLFIRNIPSLGVTVILAAVIITPLKVIKGNLFGHFEGFYENTMRSLAEATVQNQEHNIITILCIFAFTVVISLLFIIKCTYRNINNKYSLTL